MKKQIWFTEWKETLAGALLWTFCFSALYAASEQKSAISYFALSALLWGAIGCICFIYSIRDFKIFLLKSGQKTQSVFEDGESYFGSKNKLYYKTVYFLVSAVFVSFIVLLWPITVKDLCSGLIDEVKFRRMYKIHKLQDEDVPVLRVLEQITRLNTAPNSSMALWQVYYCLFPDAPYLKPEEMILEMDIALMKTERSLERLVDAGFADIKVLHRIPANTSYAVTENGRIYSKFIGTQKVE